MSQGGQKVDRRGFFKCLIGQGARGWIPTESLNQAQMGVARINHRDCLAWGGGDCTLCYVKCPLPDEAMVLEDLKPVVRAERCTGCGICEQACAIVNDRVAIRVVVPRT